MVSSMSIPSHLRGTQASDFSGTHEYTNLIEATLKDAKVGLRPIVMTSLAFGFGALPLASASGAGAVVQTAIDTGVLGG